MVDFQRQFNYDTFISWDPLIFAMLNCIYHLQLVLNELYSVHSNLFDWRWMHWTWMITSEFRCFLWNVSIYQYFRWSINLCRFLFFFCCGCRIICLINDLHRLQKLRLNSYNPTDTKFNVFFFSFVFFSLNSRLLFVDTNFVNYRANCHYVCIRGGNYLEYARLI